jgi:putative ATP-binding cassette transporter
MFLPEQPYLVPGTLRDQFSSTACMGEVSNERIEEVIRQLHLESLVKQLGGLDAEHEWRTTLSLGEQQLIAFARLLAAGPQLALLDRATSAINEARRAELYQILKNTDISYLSVGERQPSLLQSHDTLLELHLDGTWSEAPIDYSI